MNARDGGGTVPGGLEAAPGGLDATPGGLEAMPVGGKDSAAAGKDSAAGGKGGAPVGKGGAAVGNGGAAGGKGGAAGGKGGAAVGKGGTDGARAELAGAQARLVAALVAGAPLPAGFDPERARQVTRALLRKRAGTVARAWPRLAGAYAAEWPGIFVRWAEGRPPLGGWRDGFDFARAHLDTLPAPAAAELAVNEVRWAYDGWGAPRRRWLPAVRRFPGGLALGLFGRVALRRRPGGPGGRPT